MEEDFTVVDTPFTGPEPFGGPYKNYKLDTVVNALGCTLENHHRAVDDAEATAAVFLKFVERLKKDRNKRSGCIKPFK